MSAHLASLALLLAAPPDGGTTVIISPTEEAREPPAPVELGDPQALARLCAAFAPPGRAPSRGDVLARAQAAAERKKEREAALERRYSVALDARRLSFAPYDEGEEVLKLAPRTVLVGLGGALRLWATEDPQLPARAPPAAARRVLDAQRDGTLALKVVFDLAEPKEGPPCAHVPGARQYTLAVEPIAWEWAARGKVLARGGEGGDRPTVSAAEGARPMVEVGSPICEGDGGAVRDLFTARNADLLRCYADGLKRNPSLDGTLVVEVRLGARSGAPRETRISADSVHDESTATCVREVAARPGYPDEVRGLCSVPVTFALEVVR